MNKKGFVDEMGELEKLYLKIEEQEDNVKKVFGVSDCDCGVLKTMWEVFDSSTRYLAMLAGDKYEWIEWFIFECEWGEKKMEAGIGECSMVIATASDLWEIMQKEKGTRYGEMEKNASKQAEA